MVIHNGHRAKQTSQHAEANVVKCVMQKAVHVNVSLSVTFAGITAGHSTGRFLFFLNNIHICHDLFLFFN